MGQASPAFRRNDFVKDLEGLGISCDDIEGMRVRIGSNGDVAVDGIEDRAVREQVQKLIDEKYGDRMYQVLHRDCGQRGESAL